MASFLFIILSLLIQIAIILLLQNSLYYYGLALAPFISIFFLFLFIIYRKDLNPFHRDETILSHYFTFIMIFTVFFIVFCIRQALNPEDTFHLEFVLGILCWVPSILVIAFFVGIRYHFYRRFLVVLSVIMLLLVILYIFISIYNQDSEKAPYILYVSSAILFLPGLIYFLICTIIPRHTNQDRHLHNLNFGRSMKWQIWSISKCLKMKSVVEYPGIFVFMYSFVIPLCYLYVLIEYFFLFIWCFFFQAFKLFILSNLNSAHIPFSKGNQEERININLNLSILLEGLAFSFPQIILLSIHKWINSSDNSVISLIIYILFIGFALLSLTNSIINFVFNIKFDRAASGMKTEPYIFRLFPIREDRQGHNYYYQRDQLFEKIRRDIPEIIELAYMPEYAYTQKVLSHNNPQISTSSIIEELKDEELADIIRALNNSNYYQEKRKSIKSLSLSSNSEIKEEIQVEEMMSIYEKVKMRKDIGKDYLDYILGKPKIDDIETTVKVYEIYQEYAFIYISLHIYMYILIESMIMIQLRKER